jgi:hypothetical protein
VRFIEACGWEHDGEHGEENGEDYEAASVDDILKTFGDIPPDFDMGLTP